MSQSIACDFHVYCDVCGAFASESLLTARECRAELRKQGWKFRRVWYVDEGQDLCPSCAAKLKTRTARS